MLGECRQAPSHHQDPQNIDEHSGLNQGTGPESPSMWLSRGLKHLEVQLGKTPKNTGKCEEANSFQEARAPFKALALDSSKANYEFREPRGHFRSLPISQELQNPQCHAAFNSAWSGWVEGPGL